MPPPKRRETAADQSSLVPSKCPRIHGNHEPSDRYTEPDELNKEDTNSLRYDSSGSDDVTDVSPGDSGKSVDESEKSLDTRSSPMETEVASTSQAEPTSNKMEDIHEAVLRKCRRQLVKDLILPELLDELEVTEVFSKEMIADIMAKKTRYDQARKMLDDLTRRGPKAFSFFVNGLKTTKQEHLADVLIKGLPPRWSGSAHDARNITIQSSTSQKKPNEIQRVLRDWYKERLSTVLPFPWLDMEEYDIEELYTNLEVVRGRKLLMAKQKSSKRRSLRTRSAAETGDKIESRFLTTEALTDALWNPKKRTITLLEGPPGVGKSTLCKQLVFHWSNNEFRIHRHHFDYVFFLEARMLKDDLRMSIYKELFPEDFDKNLVWTCLKNAKKSCLLVIDGLDELNENGRIGVMKLLEGKCFRDINVILTGRHEALRGMVRYAANHLKIKGFTRDNIKSYIRKYFEGDKSGIGDELMERIKSSQALAILAFNPFTTAQLCFLAKYDDIPVTIAEIIEKVIEITFTIYKDKVKETCSDAITKENLFSSACQLAYNGFRRNILEFDEEEVKSIELDCPGDHLLQSGIMIRDTQMCKPAGQSIPSEKKCCFFAHRLYQEFFCASYLANLPTEDFMNTITDVPTSELLHVFPLLTTSTDEHFDKFWFVLMRVVEVFIPESELMEDSSEIRMGWNLLDSLCELILTHRNGYALMNMPGMVGINLLDTVVQKLMPLYPVMIGNLYRPLQMVDGAHCVYEHASWEDREPPLDRNRICFSSFLYREIWTGEELLDRLADRGVTLSWVHCHDLVEAGDFLENIPRIHVLSLTLFPYTNSVLDVTDLLDSLQDVKMNMDVYVVAPTPLYDDYMYLEMLSEMEMLDNENITVRYCKSKRFAPSDKALEYFQEIDWDNEDKEIRNTKPVLELEFPTSFHQLYYDTCCPY